MTIPSSMTSGVKDRLAELRVRIPEVTPGEALALQARGAALIDVREPDETALGTAPGALDKLAAAGLRRVTVSLDTLKPERFRALTRRDGHDRVTGALRAAAQAGFVSTKIDTMVIRGFNDDELADQHSADSKSVSAASIGRWTTSWTPEVASARRSKAALAKVARHALDDGTRIGGTSV